MSDLYETIDKLYDQVGHRGTGADPIDYTEKLQLVASAVEAMDDLLAQLQEEASQCEQVRREACRGLKVNLGMAGDLLRTGRLPALAEYHVQQALLYTNTLAIGEE